MAEATGGDSVDPLSVSWPPQLDSEAQVQQEGLDGIFSQPQLRLGSLLVGEGFDPNSPSPSALPGWSLL